MIVWRMIKNGQFLNLSFNNHEAANRLISHSNGYSCQHTLVAMNISEFLILGKFKDIDFFTLLNAESKEYQNPETAKTYRRFITLANYLHLLREPEAVLEFLTSNYMELSHDMLHALSVTFKQYLINEGLKVDKLINPPLDTTNINFFMNSHYYRLFYPLTAFPDSSVTPCGNYECDLHFNKTNIEKLAAINNQNGSESVYRVYKTVSDAYDDYTIGKDAKIKKDLFDALSQEQKNYLKRESVRQSMTRQRYDTAFPKDERHLS